MSGEIAVFYRLHKWEDNWSSETALFLEAMEYECEPGEFYLELDEPLNTLMIAYLQADSDSEISGPLVRLIENVLSMALSHHGIHVE